MTIYIDADACPVTRIAERIAKDHGIPVTLLCDTNHLLTSDYSTVRTIGAGADAVDLALINLCRRGDIVITQDYGLAAMCLSRNARVLNPDGKEFIEDNIFGLLELRAASAKYRRSGGRMKGPAKRTPQQNKDFEAALLAIIEKMMTP